MKERNFTCLSSFILKIIALVTMTIDHVGVVLEMNVGYNYALAEVFRGIGRLALPLFCFMICEGVIHTKRFGNYMLRLGIMATLVMGAFIIVEETPWFNGMSIRDMGNIFIDLLLGACCVYLLKRKEWYFKLLSLIPLGISVLSFIAATTEFADGILIHWFPYFLRSQYHFYSVGMIILFYLAYVAKDIFLKQYSNNSGIPVDSLVGTNIERYALNLFSVLALVTTTLGYYMIGMLMDVRYVYWMVGMQNLAMISGAFILLYNGKRGYNAKWFQYGSYLYYPIHILIIYGIGMLL